MLALMCRFPLAVVLPLPKDKSSFSIPVIAWNSICNVSEPVSRTDSWNTYHSYLRPSVRPPASDYKDVSCHLQIIKDI
jgi:hypothetical protein